ncbi:GNAT family N-acetyltransferase [Streptomyces sp. NPDC005828]|uniref:GNAT family N-acetyltransferase n=1 Tax=Streptomyces sp. NPDC005828 TaxID=3157071 RepID=UPI0034119E4E
MTITLRDVTPDDLRMSTDVEPLIRALRPALSAEAFTAFAREAHGQGLVFTVAYDAADHALAAATHRVLATSRGRVFFVDDLVTHPDRRGGGVGALLLEALKTRAREADCARVELDSGTTNQAAHRFYHSHRLTISALHFSAALT